MKSFKTILSLSIAASTCAALIACNKSGGNDPQPPPPVQQLQQPPPYVPPPLHPSQGIVRPVMKPQELNYVKCYAAILDSKSLRTSTGELDFPIIDSTKPLSQEISYLYSTMLGKITLNVQPQTMDPNGVPTSAGYMELVLADLSGTGSSTLRGNLDSHLNLKIDDKQREKYVSIDCSLEMKQGNESISLMDVGNANATYTCSTSLPQVAAPTTPIGNADPNLFTTKSKPRTLIENAVQTLKVQNDKKNSGYIVLSDERKSQERSIEWSVRYGQAFLVTTGSGSSVSTSILCQPAVNATQQK